MPTSLPSREIYVLDIPDVSNIDARFVYNYYVQDEAVSETAGIKARYSNIREDLMNSSDVKRYATRIPRWIEIAFQPIKLTSPNASINNGTMNTMSKIDTSLSSKTTGKKKFIESNLSKIISEEDFASYYYVSLDFRDSQVYQKLHNLMSGTMLFSSLMNDKSSQGKMKFNSTSGGMFLGSLASTPASIDSNFLKKAADVPDEFGKNFVSTSQQLQIKKTQNEIDGVTVPMQVNAKFVSSMIERAIKDPLCSFDSDLMNLYKSAKSVQDAARQHLKSSVISLDDYKTQAPPVNVLDKTSASSSVKNMIEIVGYIIDKFEVMKDNTTLVHDPFIIENVHTSFIVDFNTRYYSTYIYAIRAIACVTMPAIMEDMNDVVNAQFLISSKATTVTVPCLENVPPPPPSDINFIWDYDNNNLVVSWAFPPNPQRDIKKFQIYRRETIDEPFQLLRQYDFDDSAVKIEQMESVDNALVETINSPKNFYVDKDFSKNSKYIYAVTCVDAHGIASNYSAQFQLSFDVFKNRLNKTLISHMNAPRAYPNMYLETDAFVDTISDGPLSLNNPSGPHSRFTLYFTPQCYNVMQGGLKKPVVLTQQDGAKYRVLVNNLDNQRQQIVDIVIDDKLNEKV